jgi:asparagine synthetase B (glutamine-hydrolysing)
MCGIAGIVNKQGDGAIASNLYAMSQSLKHRGPDGEGFLLANIKTAKQTDFIIYRMRT